YTLSFASGATTQRERPAINAWADHGLGANMPDANVHVNSVDVDTDGRFNVAFEVTQLPSGLYHYEYAVHNQNSDRSGGSFSVPIPAGVQVTNIDFHGVFAHSGEPYPNTATNPDPWSGTVANGAITWNVPEPYASPGNSSNAIRWGTMYNFRF